MSLDKDDRPHLELLPLDGIPARKTARLVVLLAERDLREGQEVSHQGKWDDERLDLVAKGVLLDDVLVREQITGIDDERDLGIEAVSWQDEKPGRPTVLPMIRPG